MQRLCKLLGGEALEQDRRFVFAFNSPQTLLQLLTDVVPAPTVRCLRQRRNRAALVLSA